jgi:hypothetical protein
VGIRFLLFVHTLFYSGKIFDGIIIQNSYID